jgi:hypothetical protein
LGISAITFWLENKRNIVQDRFSKEFILETVKIILVVVHTMQILVRSNSKVVRIKYVQGIQEQE